MYDWVFWKLAFVFMFVLLSKWANYERMEVWKEEYIIPLTVIKLQHGKDSNLPELLQSISSRLP